MGWISKDLKDTILWISRIDRYGTIVDFQRLEKRAFTVGGKKKEHTKFFFQFSRHEYHIHHLGNKIVRKRWHFGKKHRRREEAFFFLHIKEWKEWNRQCSVLSPWRHYSSLLRLSWFPARRRRKKMATQKRVSEDRVIGEEKIAAKFAPTLFSSWIPASASVRANLKKAFVLSLNSWTFYIRQEWLLMHDSIIGDRVALLGRIYCEWCECLNCLMVSIQPWNWPALSILLKKVKCKYP